MGWWKSSRGTIGDSPADILDSALKMILQVYKADCGRLPTQGELADLLEFCMNGAVVGKCGCDDMPWSKELVRSEAYPRARSRGFQGILGPAAVCKEGEMVNVDPKSGDHYEKGEFSNLVHETVAHIEKSCDACGGTGLGSCSCCGGRGLKEDCKDE